MQERRSPPFWWYTGAYDTYDIKLCHSSLTTCKPSIGGWGWQTVHSKRLSSLLFVYAAHRKVFVVPHKLDPECMYTEECPTQGGIPTSWLHSELNTLLPYFKKKVCHNNSLYPFSHLSPWLWGSLASNLCAVWHYSFFPWVTCFYNLI